MIKRLAVVIWWCGAAIGAFALGSAALAWGHTIGCDQARANLAHIKREADRAYSRWYEEAKRANPDKSDIELTLKSGAPAKPDGQSEAEHAVEHCDHAARNASEGAFLSLAALPFFAIAYVLGGSFFRPPRVGSIESK